MVKNISRLITLMLTLGFTSTFSAQVMAVESTKPDQILEHIVQAYGGRTALEGVKVVKHSGTMQSYRLGKTGALQRLFELPGKLLVDINYPDGPHEQRITTPAGAWRDGRPATSPMHMAMKLQAARFQLPLLLTQHPVTVLEETADSVHLGLKLTDSTSLEVFVDRQSWRIVRSVGRMSMGGMNVAFTADYSDFRKVDGILFAHREDLTAMGVRTGIAVLERIEVNPQTHLDDFKPRVGDNGKGLVWRENNFVPVPRLIEKTAVKLGEVQTDP